MATAGPPASSFSVSSTFRIAATSVWCFCALCPCGLRCCRGRGEAGARRGRGRGEPALFSEPRLMQEDLVDQVEEGDAEGGNQPPPRKPPTCSRICLGQVSGRKEYKARRNTW